jgi:glycosyl transferase, family 25
MITPPALFAAYDRIVIVNLPERVERRRWMERQLATFGLADDARVFFLPAFRMKDKGKFRRVGSHGAFLSHLTALTWASKYGESVLILQDDCQFLPAIWDYPAPVSDVFYGSHAEDAPEIIGAHFMGFNKGAAAKATGYLSDLLEGAIPHDARAMKQPGYDPSVLPPIDGSLVWFRRAHPMLSAEFALLSRQRQFTSDCTPKWFDRVPLIGSIANAWRSWNGGRANHDLS